MSDHLKRLNRSITTFVEAEQVNACSNLEDAVESPIEIMLGAALVIVWRLVHDSFGVPEEIAIVEQADLVEGSGVAYARLVPQFKKGRERYDFALLVPSVPSPIFIECDGHDFHERTKEQAKKDRSRDRRIQGSGAFVLRFTGSEIWADPAECAIEIIDFVSRSYMHPRFSR